MRARYASQLEMLVAFAALLLMIGCVNLSGLLLTRTIARGHQFAVRVALGASRTRLVQQQLVETLFLALTGTLLALPLAWWTSAVLGRILWASALPLAMSTTPDARVFGIVAAIALTTGLLIGVLPAWAVTRSPIGTASLSAQPSASRMGRSSKLLLVAQVALSLILLVSAALFARTLANLRANEGSFMTGILFTRLWIDPDDHRTHDDASYYSTLTRELSQLPGVAAVGFSMYFPSYINLPRAAETIARTDAPDRSDEVAAITDMVSPRLFETVGVARLQGRDFTWDDSARSTPVAILNATLAHVLYPSGNAIGGHIRIGNDTSRPSIEIVGVVADAALGNVREPHGPLVFRPILQESQRAMVPLVHLRTAGDPRSYGDALTRIVASFGRHFVRRRMLTTLDEHVDQALLQERLLSAVSSFFAALAVLVACVGLYGLLTYAVIRRTREIGVRIALGATRRSVLRMIIGEGLVLVLAGVMIGIPGAVAIGRFTRSLLYGLAPDDPSTLVATASGFLAVAAAAALWPAMRAASIEPMQALRHD